MLTQPLRRMGADLGWELNDQTRLERVRWRCLRVGAGVDRCAGASVRGCGSGWVELNGWKSMWWVSEMDGWACSRYWEGDWSGHMSA